MKLLPLIFVILMGCSSSQEAPKSSPTKTQGQASLTQEQAFDRSEKISHVSYDLFFDLTGQGDEFKGEVLIEFDLNDNDEDLRIDFSKGNVQSVEVNGSSAPFSYDKESITINEKSLKEGYNAIKIAFSHEYSKNGSGLYRYKDNEDGRIYIYSDLEPYDANKIFPGFDQPNLKAHYKSTVKVPNHWVVSTYAREVNIQSIGTSKIWSFPRSAKFSTYIWSLHAGEYHVVEDKKAKYPSRLFMRQSMKKYVNINDWQTFTRQSFEFLDEYFGITYPYQKYDQLIVPDFNAGAMENVAAVTFAERFVSRGEKTQKARRRLANVIFHEMAHMWFGNLVTMNWWDDLWLNESFATYIAYLGVSRNTEFKDVAWRDFYRTKSWAYWEDQLVTTHPIVTEVPDTKQAFANFDGITYGKGASSLKQIHYFLGEEGFKKGLKIYFRRYALENTKLKDFMGALGEGSGKDLEQWQESWLETTGVNGIKVAPFKCVNNKLNSLTLKQLPSPNGEIRPHTFEVAFLNKDGDSYKVTSSKKVQMNEEELLVSLDNISCPDLVYPNFNDHDYLRVAIDKNSLSILEKNISGIEDVFLRQMLWASLWDMVYYGEYSYKKYYDVAMEGLKIEKDPIILAHILSSLNGGFSNVLTYAHYDANTAESSKVAMQKLIYNRVLTRLKSIKPGSESQKFLYGALVGVSKTKEQLSYLESILNGKTRFSGLKIDQDKRWSIIAKLSRFNHPLAEQKVKREQKKDNSSRAKKWALAIEAQKNDQKVKAKWLETYKSEQKEYSFSELKFVLRSLFPLEQDELKRKFFASYLEDLKTINLTKESHIATTFAKSIPTACSNAHSKALSDFLESNEDDLQAGVLKQVRVKRQENQRCVKALETSK